MPHIEGPWNIEIATPMGTQRMTLHLGRDGDLLTGTASGDAGDLTIRDGQVDGDTIDFTVDMTFPFAMALHFTLTVDGDSLAGSSQAGSFPRSTS